MVLNDDLKNMENNVLEKHNFERAKNEIQAFSKTAQKKPELSTVATGGSILKFTNHNVTGVEFNTLVRQTQNGFININSTLISIIKEFGKVYNAFDSLDKEYIDAILSSIELVRKVSEEAKKVSLETNGNTVDIKKIVQSQKETLHILCKFKERIDGIDIFNNADVILPEYKKINDNIYQIKEQLNDYSASTERSIGEVRQQVSQNLDAINSNEIAINKLVTFKDNLQSQKHLNEIDTLWDLCNTLGVSINEMNQAMIDRLEKLTSEIALESTNRELLKADITSNLALHAESIQRIEERVEFLNENTEKRFNEIESEYKVVIQKIKRESYCQNLRYKKLYKKIKVIFVILGITSIVAIASMILNLLISY